jgi:hypothetical protein
LRLCVKNKNRGVALVITLILLSVTLVMVLAFLAISGRERGSVTTQTDTTTTRLAADAGLAAAEAQIAANILSTTNPYSFGLIVSTNSQPYLPPLTTAQLQQTLISLQYSPRPPVFIPQNGTNDFRYYLDLNRNGMDDPSGWIADADNTGASLGTTNFQVGDPEWIGVLARPDQPYGPNNPFIARYAFIALPVGNALDLNAIHNQALSRAAKQKSAASSPIDPDYYARNQGVGSWELNLAAFLTDLNTNEWNPVADPYNYKQPLPDNWGNYANAGRGFEDAFALLTNRYAGYYKTLPSVSTLFGPAGATAFASDYIDGYTDGPLMTNAQLQVDDDGINFLWLGADNTNHFFTPEELFNTNETASFGINLQNAGTNQWGGAAVSTYDRYTFYRMLSQLGTDTTPESGRMNLNYDNLDPGANGALNTNGTASATNFVAWQPLAFFTNAADRMLKACTVQWAATYIQTNGALLVTNNPNFVATFNVTAPFGVTNIPVWVSNRFVYTPAVQHVLQLAANIFDASTNSYFPSVFRPLFSRDQNGTGTNLYVSGYAWVPSVTGTGDPLLATPVDAMALATTNSTFVITNLAVNVYGVPWIIGAKKGFPNFNEFVLENIVGVTRRLQFMRDTNAEAASFPKIFITRTNQMYLFSINSSYGLDFWNSYSSNFMDNVTVVCRGNSWMTITNDELGFNSHPGIAQPIGFGFGNTNNSGPLYSSYWPGSSSLSWGGYQPHSTGQPNPYSFIIPLNYLYWPTLTNSVYRTSYAYLTPGTLAGFTGPCLIPTNYFGSLGMTKLFETNTPGFPLPHFGLLTTNRLQVFILDLSNGIYHVIDYAHLEQNDSRDLNAQIFSDDPNGMNNSSDNVGVWNTNIDYSYSATGIPYGIENQILISKDLAGQPGGPPSEDGNWQPDAEATQYGTTPTAQQASFQAFFQPYGNLATAHKWGRNPQASASNIQATAQAPYAPTRYAVSYTLLQANDPLIHYLTSDMALSYPAGLLDLQKNYNNSISNVPTPATFNLGALNYNYQPWKGNPSWPSNFFNLDPNAYNMAERDPLVSQPDNWIFPTNKFPTVGWLGRVHRGTPWQTVYLKATNLLNQIQIQTNAPPPTPPTPPTTTNYIGWKTWMAWTGNPNPFDAANAAPVTDRLLFDLFTTAFNDNATRGTLSINQSADRYDPVSNPAAGLAAWSALFSGIVVPPVSPASSYTVIAPTGTNGVNSALGVLVTNINYARDNFINADGLVGVFEHEGDILSVPQLTDQSPFLDPTQTGFNSDAMYEWLPQQVMSLVRVGTPRYVIYSYGQALKPAPLPNGIFTANGLLITNYQIVSEIATRAVVRLDTVRTNVIGTNSAIFLTPPHAVIESFNILPPD